MSLMRLGSENSLPAQDNPYVELSKKVVSLNFLGGMSSKTIQYCAIGYYDSGGKTNQNFDIIYTDYFPYGNYGAEDVLSIQGKAVNILDKGLDGRFNADSGEIFDVSGVVSRYTGKDEPLVQRTYTGLISGIELRKP